MTFSPETSETIETLAGVGYTVEEIAIYQGYDVEQLQREFSDRSSEFSRLYHRGILKKHAERDISLSASATAGSITAIQTLENRMAKRHITDFKNRLLNGY